VKPWIVRGRARAEGGGELTLHQRDHEFVIRVDGRELMSSRRHGSEDELARIGCAGLGPSPRVLVGGLGLGFTLRAALEVLPAGARVVVAELVDAVVAWNRDVLGHLAGHPLRDPRVEVIVGDVADAIRAPGEGFDGILLDMDNGPEALVRADNAALYAPAGLAAVRAALRPGGAVAVWSADRDEAFARALRRAGFDARVHDVEIVPGRRGARHAIFVGRR
jgi:spermidine synthase